MLIDAAGQGNTQEVERLLASRADVNARTAAGETPLHVAGIQCVRGTIDALLKAGANVNAKTLPGETMSMTPLHWYVNMNPCGEEEVRLLLRQKPDLNAKNTHGETPLDMVAKIESREHIADMLRRAGRGDEL